MTIKTYKLHTRHGFDGPRLVAKTPSGIRADRICKCQHGYKVVWEIIKGPDYLIGQRLRQVDITNGGWHNGEIHARNIIDGRILVRMDSVEAVI